MSGKVKEQWYLQIEGERLGPLTTLQVSRYLLLRRLNPDSLASRDGETWCTIADLPELQPHVLLVNGDLSVADRLTLEATAQWVRQQAEQPTHDELREDENRRSPASSRRWVGYGALLLIVSALILLIFLTPERDPVAVVQCEAEPAPRINWSQCSMQGRQLDGVNLVSAVMRGTNFSQARLRAARLLQSDLAYANLSLSDLSGAQLQGASMVGVNLRNANLRDANLQGADLSYADLSGAELEGANLANTRLGSAIWEENLLCMPHSVGRCIPAQSRP